MPMMTAQVMSKTPSFTNFLPASSVIMTDAGLDQGSRTFIPVPRAAVTAAQGSKRYMEDMHAVLDDISEEMSEHGLESDERASVFAVYDGHGGEYAAEFVRDNMLANILRQESFHADRENALRQGFLQTDKDLKIDTADNGEDASGTTSLVTLLLGRKLYCANAGDCRAVLCKRGMAVDLSVDHKPSSESESRRIEASGGFVDSEGYVNGALSVSRVLGDFHLDMKNDHPDEQPGALTAEPDVTVRVLSRDDEFMILASDGLWDVFNSQNAVELARESLRMHNDPAKCSRDLVEEALRRNSVDNVTALVVCFSEDPPPKRQYKSEHDLGVKRTMSMEGLSSLKKALDSYVEEN
mmetsp:Transcript_2426/g.4060  ORF Transcript_2426/g.4060 Transcript_2426/m.4060 type:complete len:353 (+) Transcript_2426:119-1177(+)